MAMESVSCSGTVKVLEMKSPLVYCIILNWNSAADTVECMESLQKTDYENYRIVIVDNGSSDDSEAVLRKKFPLMDFIQTGNGPRQ